MYDVDGNGSVDLTEMTRILSSLYKMMGPGGRQDRAEERAVGIFHRMDVSDFMMDIFYIAIFVCR